jgi:neutral ceramidase
MLPTLLLTIAPNQYLVQTYNQLLSPSEQLPLGGYTERGDKISVPGGDPLYAHILILTQQNSKVALVSFEGLTVPESLHREVQRRIDIPVFLVATHTHCAPDTQMLNERMTFRIPGISTYKSNWLDWYSLKIAGGIAIAQQQQPAPVRLKIDQSISTLARSRRPNSPVSNRLTRIETTKNEPLITVFGAHATCHDSDTLQTSGDWPGSYMQKFGGLVFPGAIGNASPNIDGGTGDEKSERVAEKLHDTPAHFKSLGPSLTFFTEPIKLDKPVPHPDFARDNKINDAIAQIVVNKFAPLQSTLSAVQIGNHILLGVPGEPTNDLEVLAVAAIEKRGYTCSVISHCNGWMGYILAPQDYDRGGYEATLSLHGRETGLRLIEAVERLAKKLPIRAKVLN